MFQSADASAPAIGELRSGHGPWNGRAGGLAWERLRHSRRVPVAIVGAGITGALVAQALASAGHGVAVIDRLVPGQGSTAASTAMLQWELDTKLSELADLYGFETAAAVYRRSFAAVRGLRGLVRSAAVACDWRDRRAVFLAGAGDGAAVLKAEHAVRTRAGLPGLLRQGQAGRSAAIVSPGAAEADPVRLSHGLLRDAEARGAALVAGEVVAYALHRGGVTLALAGDREIEAARLVLATGYALPDFIAAPAHRRSASWAAATEAGAELGFWPGRALVWEDASPYLYMRTTADGRILVGGEDEPVADPARRAALTAAKAAALHRKAEGLWGRALPHFAMAWSAAFGETTDGLPLIGPVPGWPHVFAAYGYGGNGITFSYLASRLIAALIAGPAEPWSRPFALDRPGKAAALREL